MVTPQSQNVNYLPEKRTSR